MLTSASDPLRFEVCVLLALKRVEVVEQPGRRHSERRRGFAGGPDVDEAVNDVLFHLKPEVVTRRSRIGRATAETSALVANDRLHRREELRRCHDADRHACPLEHGVDHLPVVEVRDDGAVLNRVTADDAVRRHLQAEDGVARA